jgi:hypothetical protein
MIDTVLWTTGLLILGGAAAVIVSFIGFLLYKTFKAAVDILSQYFLLYMEKRKPECSMSWIVWWTSFDQASWSVIFYRIKRAFGKATREDDPRMAVDDRWTPGR